MKRLLCVFILLFIPITSVWAVKMSSLYQAEVPMASQTEELKEQAIQDGFLQVLIKVSGDAGVGDNPVIKAGLQKASYYVQEYSYSQPTTSSSEYILQIRYEPEDVLRLLRKAEIPYWRENRPLILVWLANQNQDETEIIGNETPGNILDLMKQQGKKYGLPLIFPVMDFTDLNQVTDNDVTEMNLPALNKAAKRYSPDALLLGHMQATKDGIQSQWKLILGKNEWTWKISDATTDTVISGIIDQISQLLAKHYEVKTTSVATTLWLKLIISDVTQGTDLTSLMQYLQQLTPVQQVRLMQINGDTVEIAVLVQGSLEGFEQSAVIGQHLVLKTKDANTDVTNQLYYEWVH